MTSIVDQKKVEAYWARLHIASDRAAAAPIKPTIKRSGTLLTDHGVRVSRGGFSEERRP